MWNVLIKMCNFVIDIIGVCYNKIITEYYSYNNQQSDKIT